MTATMERKQPKKIKLIHQRRTPHLRKIESASVCSALQASETLNFQPSSKPQDPQRRLYTARLKQETKKTGMVFGSPTRPCVPWATRILLAVHPFVSQRRSEGEAGSQEGSASLDPRVKIDPLAKPFPPTHFSCSELLTACQVIDTALLQS